MHWRVLAYAIGPSLYCMQERGANLKVRTLFIISYSPRDIFGTSKHSCIVIHNALVRADVNDTRNDIGKF